jgi:hypothetical protein
VFFISLFVWPFSKEGIGGYRAKTTVKVKEFWIHSVHAQMAGRVVGKDDACE